MRLFQPCACDSERLWPVTAQPIPTITPPWMAMAQNPRHFLRQLTPNFARAYLHIRSLSVPPSIWTLHPDKQSQRLALHVCQCDDPAANSVLADVARCMPFVSEMGQQTLA